MKIQGLSKQILAAVFLMTTAFGSFAYDFEENGIYYRYVLTSSGERDYTKCVVSNDVNDKYEGDLVIPETVQNGTVQVVGVANLVFSECTELTSVVLPNSVTEIGIKAFYGCTSLTHVDLGEGLEKIGFQTSSGNADVFAECSSLKSITIPNKVETLWDGTFEYCTSLETVVLGDHLKSIRDEAFYNCLNIVDITSLNPTPPDLYSDVFSEVLYEKAVVRVPVGSVDSYRKDWPWREFKNIIEIGNGAVNDIADDAVSVKAVDGRIIVDGVGSDVETEVYNLAGQCVYRGVATSLALDKGLYIVRVGGCTFKVTL